MESPARRIDFAPLAGFSVVLLAAIAGTIWSWGTWPDPTIDFGRELYVPWRLTRGDVLYRDIAAFNGPFSHYLLAGWFALTQVSLHSLIVLNLLTLVGTLALVRALVARVASAGAATLACLTFVGVFAYGHLAPAYLIPMGNFNWLAPYSHELTHGITLVLLGLYLLGRFTRVSRIPWLAGSGFALGLAFLTKAEVFVAGAAASLTGLGAFLWLDRTPAVRVFRILAIWVGCALLPILGSVLLLSAAMPLGEALLATLGTWPHLFDTTHMSLPYFRWGLGFDDPVASLVGAGVWLGLYAAAWAPVVAVAMSGKPVSKPSVALAFALTAVVCLTLWLGFGWIGWFEGSGLLQWNNLTRPWQFLLALIAAGFAVEIARRRVSPEERPVAALRIALIAFALLLLGKMILNVRAYHYGFALAAPAACVVVAAFFCWLPQVIERRGGNGALVKSVFAAVLCVTVAAHLAHAGRNMDLKDQTVGAGADSFRAGPRGRIVSETLAFLERNGEPGATAVALPEGIMLNYLTRMANPTPFLQTTPPLIALFGEATMVDALAENPPDWVLLVHRDDSEYGTPYFGRDYGLELRRWIVKHYKQIALFGDRPFRGDGFGISVMKRRG